MRALGREAAFTGWDDVGAALEADIEGGFWLLAWWDDLRANVADALVRMDRVAPGPGVVDAVLAAWLADVRLPQALRFAAGWHHFIWGDRDDDTVRVPADAVVPVPFDGFVLRGGVRVEPLATRAALVEEGEAMRHCVASHWSAVARGLRLVVSLRAVDGSRATGAWMLRDDGYWHCREAAGPSNKALGADTPLSAAVDEFTAELDAGRCLLPDALAWFQAAAAAEPPRAADYAVGGACLVSALPPAMAPEALRWLPGQGGLDPRVAHAASLAAGLASNRKLLA